MSSQDIRGALQGAVADMNPPLPTAWQNKTFNPATDAPNLAPYQRVSIILASPGNDEMGRSFYERGIMQVSLHYPPDTGPTEAELRADQLRSVFYRGSAFPRGGVVVKIMKTPTYLPPHDDDEGRYVLPVSIEFQVSVQN